MRAPYELPARSWTLHLDDILEKHGPMANIWSAMVYAGRMNTFLVKVAEEFTDSDERIKLAVADINKAIEER